MLNRIALVCVALLLAALIVPNGSALSEGARVYLLPALFPDAPQPIRREGRYASVYDLVRLRNTARRDYVLHHLAASNLTIEPIPIPASLTPNLFVRFNATGPYTIFAAHYDKLHDDAEYQGASDNTAAVSVLLAAAIELARRGDAGNRAFLFTGEEETGMRGARAFVEHARANDLAIREIINFDNIGRGELAIRPPAEIVGWVFTLPLVGDFAFDGHTLRPSPPYAPANARLAQALERVQPHLIVLAHFTCISDSNEFQARGIDTVAISGSDMHFLEQTWHSYADRVEWLDEHNLDLAFELVLNYR